MTTCAHLWDIAVPDGPTSIGVCRYCGDTKEFANHIALAQIYGKQSGGLPFSLTNPINDQIEGDIRAAMGATFDYTRKG